MKFFLACLIVLVAHFSHNQTPEFKDFKVSSGAAYSSIKGSTWYYANSENQIVAFTIHRKGNSFQRFDQASLNATKLSVLSKLPKRSTIEHVIQIENRCCIFYSTYSNSSKRVTHYVKELDLSSGKFLKAKKVFDKKVSVDDFEVVVNLDKSEILLWYRLKPKVWKDAINKDKFGFYVYSNAIEPIWDTIMEMPYTEKKMNNAGICMDNETNVYLLAEVFKDEPVDSTKKIIEKGSKRSTKKKMNEDGSFNYDLDLIRIDHEDQKMTETKLALENKYLINYGFFTGLNNEINLSGYYSNGTRGLANGVYNYRLNSEGEILGQSTAEFDLKVIQKFETKFVQAGLERADQKEKLGLYYLKLREKVVHLNGSVSTVGEQYHVVKQVNTKTGEVTYKYYYDDIIISNFDAEGKMNWMQKIPKRQIGRQGKGRMGYKLVERDNHLYFIFMDHRKNATFAEDHYIQTYQDGAMGVLTVMQVAVESGELKRGTLLDTKKFNGMRINGFGADEVIEMPNGELITGFGKGFRKFILLRIKLGIDANK